MSSRPGDLEGFPAHVAWVADDDGDATAAPTSAPERQGEESAEDAALLELVAAARERGIAWLSVQEPSRGRVLEKRARELLDQGVEVVDLGSASRNRPATSAGSRRARREAPALRVLVVPPHSGKTGFVEAVLALADGAVTPKKVGEKAIGAALGIPDVDLLVVTGGDRRVPDLLLWQVAYSEIVFLPERWPRAGRDELDKALDEYRRRDRRYGGLVAAR